MEHSYEEASSDDNGEVVVLKNEVDSQFLKSGSPQNFQFTGPPPFRYLNTITAAKQREVGLYPQPKILLEKLCIDTNKATTVVSSKLDDVSGVRRTDGLMETGDGKTENAENGLKRKSPSSVRNKKKPYRSVARSEMQPDDGDTGSQGIVSGEAGSGLVDRVSPREETESLQNRLEADDDADDEANNNASDSCPGMSSSCLTLLKDNQASCLTTTTTTTKRDESCRVADNFTDDVTDSDLRDAEEQSADPNRNFPSNNIASAVCDDAAVSVSETMSGQTVVNSSGRLKLSISRIHSRSRSQNDEGMDCRMSSTGDTAAAPTVTNIKRRGNRIIARYSVTRSVNDVPQRLQFARKFAKPYRRQRYPAKWFDFGEKVKNYRDSVGTRCQRDKDRVVDTKESDEDYDVPAKKLHPEPSSEQLEAASTTGTRRVGYSAEVPHDRSVFADISFADDNSRSRPKPRDTAPCSKSEWDAGGVDSKDDDKISSTVVGCSNAGEAAQSSCFANRRENIFEMFRSPIETEGTAAECLNLSSRPPMEPPRVPEETAPQPRDKDPTLAAAAAAATMSSPDIKDLFGDGDSDSTECCRYEELDQLFGDNSAPPAGGQIGGGQRGGQPVTFYPEFFPFNLPSDSDDNLIVDESTECQRADSSEKVKDPTRKANHDEQQDSDEDRQLRKLRSTAYRTYTRMQRRRGRRGGGGGGGVGTGQRLNQSAVTETASTTTTMAAADDAIFKPPENHVTRRRRMNAAKQTAMKRKPIELIINGSSDAMAIPSRRRQTLMEAVAEKKKDKNKKKRKNSRGSSSTQKAVRLLCKEFTTRSKSRTAKGLEGEEKGEGESDRFRSSDVPDHDAADVTENPERRRHHREPEVVAKSAPGDKLRVKRSRSKSKPSSSSDSRIAKKSGRPGKCRASAVKVKVKVKVPSESDPNQPPKIDILSRELGPRYNWLEQKIQAMQRGSSDDVTEAVRGGQLGPKTGTTAAAPGPDKEQPAGGRGCASDGEDGRRSNPKCSNQRSSNSSTFLSSSNSTGSPSSLRNNSTSGEWLSTARERRTTTDDNHSCTDRKDLAIGVSHDPASARTGLREVAFPTEGHPVALKEARPTSAYSAPSAPDVCLPAAAVNDCDYTASALSADPRMCADFLRGIEPRPGTTCPSLSHSDGTSHRGTPGGLGRGYASSSSSSSFVAPGESAADDGPLVLARSVSLTNLNSEDDRYYKGAGVQYHDGPVPFDLRLPKVSCNNNNNNNTNNKNACKEENNSERHVETPSSNSNTTLGHVTPFPNDDWASRIALFPVAESGRWLQEDAKDTEDTGIGGGVIDPIVIDLTSEAEPRPLRPTEEEETSRPPQASSRSGSPPPPVLRSIKNEYERRLEMYERLSRVSKIKDQEIAILESERKRVRGELECLRNIFLKAAAGQSQATIEEAVGGTLLDAAAAAAAEDFGKISEAHSRESTARLLASRTPPEAHSAKIDLNMYSYLKCQYERERSIVDFTTSDPKGSNGSSSGVPDPGPGGISSSAMEMLSRSWSPASPFPSSSTKVRSASPMVRPVAQQHDPAAKVEEVRRGSDEQAWIGLPSVNDSEQLDGVPSGLVVPRHHVTSDRGKWLPVSDQIGTHRPSSSYPDSQRSSLSEAASNQSGRRHGNASARENDVIIIGDESKRPKTVDTIGRRIHVQNEAMDLSGGKSTCCIPAGTEVLNARNTPVRVNTDEDRYPVGADAALNLMKSRGPDSFHDGFQLRIGREFDGGATKVTAKQADSWKGSDENRASCISTELSELFGSEPTTVRTNGSSESSSSNHRKPEHGFRRREERRAPAEEEEEEKEGQGPGHAVDGEKQRIKRSDRYRRGASSEQQQQQQQAGPSVEPMLAPTGSGFEFASTGRSTISGLDQQPPLGRGVEGPRRASVPHPVVPEPVAPPVDRSGDLLPGTAQLRLPKQQQQQQKMETFPSYPDRHGMSANLQDMSFMISAISKSAFPPRSSSSSSSGGTNRLAEQQQKSTTHDSPARPATNEKFPAHQDVVAMTTASSSSNHGRNIIHQRDPDRGERRLLAPYPSEPPMRLYRRGVVHPGAAQLLESATGGSVPSLQRYNELHQAMNRQARQHMQQHLNGPAVVPAAAGLNPRETMLAPLSTSAARSEPPVQEAAVQYRRLTGSGGAPQIPPLRHPDGRPAQQQDGFGSVSLQADAPPNRPDGLPFHSYQKAVPVPVQVRQHGFHAADPSTAHHPYIREPAQPADFNGSAFRMAPDMQRDGGAALVPCSADEGLTAPTKLLNAVALVNNILFPETPQARPPQRPVNKNDAYEPGGPGSNNPERPEYVPVGPGIHASNSQIARVNQDSIPGRGHGGGHRRPVDFHRRHLDPVSMMQQQQQPHSMDPSKVPPPPLPPPPVSGLRDSLRLHHSLATDRYLPTYIESISAPPQQPYRTSKTVHTSQQVPNQPPRHSTTAAASRDDPSKNFQLPPPPGARPDRNPARMHPTSAGVNNNNNNDAAASLIPHNQHSFYSPPTGVLQLGFNSGNANPGVLQVERHQFRPGYEQPCNTEGFVPSPYTAGNRIHMGTNLIGVNAMTNNQPTAMATHLRHRQQQQQQQQQQRTPEVIQSNRTVQMRIQATQDPNKSHQEQISSTTKAADYICDVCRKPAMFVCSACKGVAYCSTECQAVSWQTKHSAVCRQL